MSQARVSGDGFSVSFTDREVTAWGGLALLKRMLDSMGLRQAVAAGECLRRVRTAAMIRCN